MLNQSPTYSVRFFIRASRGREELTPLRVKVWITALKKYVYVSTDVSITPNQFNEFSSDGTPTSQALPLVAWSVNNWRIAVNIVVADIIERGRMNELTNEIISQRSKFIVGHIRENAKISTPMVVKTCDACVFRASLCRAPWPVEASEEAAYYADAANMCNYRTLIAALIGDTPYFLWQPNPDIEGVLLNDGRINAAATTAWNEFVSRKGGNK